MEPLHGRWSFDPFERDPTMGQARGQSLSSLLGEFSSLRSASLERLRELDLQPDQLELQGLHPALGLEHLQL